MVGVKVKVRTKRPGPKKPRAWVEKLIDAAIEFLVAVASGVVAALVLKWLGI